VGCIGRIDVGDIEAALAAAAESLRAMGVTLRAPIAPRPTPDRPYEVTP